MHNDSAAGSGRPTPDTMASPNVPNGVPVAKEQSEESLEQVCARIHGKVERFLSRETKSERIRRTQEQTRIGLEVIGQALEKYSYEELSVSYNGGKDCLVLLILYLAALHTHTTTTPNARKLPPTLQSIYIIPPDPFDDVTTFVASSSAEYRLSLSHSTEPMKDAFGTYLSAHPTVKAIFVGTRRTDPHGKTLTAFDPTDRGWPSFMRVHPVIDWQYVDVWTFIREVGVEYCGLYDRGYTSLGGVGDTLPNPALKREGVEGQFRPAYELIEDEEERLGRDH